MTPDKTPTTFSDFYPDILLRISDFLSPIDYACFALCTRTLSNLIKQKAWAKLREQSEEDQYTFKYLLTMDDPQFFICNICEKLHSLSDVIWPNMRHMKKGVPYACPRKPEQYYPSNSLGQKEHSTYRIHFTHVQLVCEGKLPLEAFKHLELKSPRNSRSECGTMLSTDARVVGGELLLRSQLWIIVPSLKRDEIIEEGLFGNICEYIGGKPSQWIDERFPKLLKCRINHLDGRSKLSDCRHCTKLIQCDFCHMEFKIDGKELKIRREGPEMIEQSAEGSVEDDIPSEPWWHEWDDAFRPNVQPDFDELAKESEDFTAIYITRYLNLGPGLIYSNPKWQSHMVEDSDVDPRDYPNYAKGSYREAFEAANGPGLEEFTADNERRLLGFKEPRTGTDQPYTIPADEEGYNWEIEGNFCWLLTRNEMPVAGPPGPLEKAPDGEAQSAQEKTIIQDETAITEGWDEEALEEMKTGEESKQGETSKS